MFQSEEGVDGAVVKIRSTVNAWFKESDILLFSRKFEATYNETRLSELYNADHNADRL